MTHALPAREERLAYSAPRLIQVKVQTERRTLVKYWANPTHPSVAETWFCTIHRHDFKDKGQQPCEY